MRAQVLRLVSLPLWHSLSRGRLQLELHAQPQLAKHWRSLAKKEAKAAQQEGHVPAAQRPEATFLPGLIAEFLKVLVVAVPGEAAMEVDGGDEAAAAGGTGSSKLDRQALLYCERFVEFLTDLLSQVGGRVGGLVYVLAGGHRVVCAAQEECAHSLALGVLYSRSFNAILCCAAFCHPACIAASACQMLTQFLASCLLCVIVTAAAHPPLCACGAGGQSRAGQVLHEQAVLPPQRQALCAGAAVAQQGP